MERKKIEITEVEKDMINRLAHPLYTVGFLEEWLNRDEDVREGTMGALPAMSAKGYYEGVRWMVKYEERNKA